MIRPTIGRQVWFWRAFAAHPEQPEAATVAFVHDDRSVNLQVLDHDGDARTEAMVTLRQPEDPKPERGRFCEWMPYQIGQAHTPGAIRRVDAEQAGTLDSAQWSDIAANIAAAATAPRVTEGDIAANIVGEYYFTAHEGAAGVQALAAARGVVHEITCLAPIVVIKAHPRLRDVTFCVLVLRNAFVVVGKSVPVAPENFDAKLGRKYARADAVNQCWPLMGYALREKLHAETARTPIWPQIAAAAIDDDQARATAEGMPEAPT